MSHGSGSRHSGVLLIPFASMTQPGQEAAPATVLPGLDCTAKAGPSIAQALEVSSVGQLVWIIIHPHPFANATQN